MFMGRYSCPHFPDGEIEAPGNKVTCPRSQSWEGAQRRPGSSMSEVCTRDRERGHQQPEQSVVFRRPPRRQQILKDIRGQPSSLAPCLPSPACPSSKSRRSNLRAHTALTTPLLRVSPPNGFPFPTADSPSSFSQHSRPPAVWPQVHFLLPPCPLLLSTPRSGLFIPPPQAVFGPHPAFA